MASTNQSPFYQRAEQEFHEATSDSERIACLEVMIKECPKHKSSENMLRNLTTRLKKLKEKSERQKKSGKSSVQGIKKTGLQCVLIGFPNSGKSSLFSAITNTNYTAAPHPFSTIEPGLGTFLFENTPVQIIDLPSFPYHDKSLVNATDTVIIVISTLEEIPKAMEYVYRSKAKRLFLFNKIDLLSEEALRKLKATAKSKFPNERILFTSAFDSRHIETVVKKEIFSLFSIVRVFTKEPGKEPSKEPMILRPGATVSVAAEKILKGMSKRIKRTKLWGPSSKFPGQIVGLNHILKDSDSIEFQTF